MDMNYTRTTIDSVLQKLFDGHIRSYDEFPRVNAANHCRIEFLNCPTFSHGTVVLPNTGGFPVGEDYDLHVDIGNDMHFMDFTYKQIVRVMSNGRGKIFVLSSINNRSFLSCIHGSFSGANVESTAYISLTTTHFKSLIETCWWTSMGDLVRWLNGNQILCSFSHQLYAHHYSSII
jgi:hypothetical protein